MTGNLNGGGRGGGGEGPCGACKFLRSKCVRGSVFAPYFDAEQGTARFAAIHKCLEQAMLLRLPLHKRIDAVATLCDDALARHRDPVYGSVGHLFSLQHQQPPFDLALNNEYPMELTNLDVVWEEEQSPQAGNEDREFQELAM